MRRGAIVRVVTIALLAAAAATAVAILIDWLPAADSKEAERIDLVFWVVVAICIGVFAVVAAITIYSVVKFRVRPDDDSDGPPIHGHTGLEIVWTAVPAILVIILGIVSAFVLSENGNAGPNPLQVKVIGQQFAWKFEYPDDVKSGELVLPVGRETKFTMEAVDVIHSFWVPNFGQKMDAVPGIETTILVTPTRTGEFAVVCAELCGLGHATMRAKARVVSEAEFDKWIAEQKA